MSMPGLNKGGFQWQNWNLTTGYKPMQWRSTVSAPLCGFCNKAVYPAEEVMGAGQKFHKFCLKCTSCNTLLNTGNLNTHDKKIYCLSCYRRHFGIGRGMETSLSLNVNTSMNNLNLNRTEINVDNHRYKRKISIGSSTFDDNSRYNNPYIRKVTYIGGIRIQQFNSPSSATNLKAFNMISISGNICPRCSKNVYSAEEVKAVGKSFHKQCYNCAHCKGSISGARYSEHNGELYDNNCYKRLFGPKGILLTGN